MGKDKVAQDVNNMVTSEVVSHKEFLIYKKSKAKKAVKDLENEVISSAVFLEEDLNKIKSIKQ